MWDSHFFIFFKTQSKILSALRFPVSHLNELVMHSVLLLYTSKQAEPDHACILIRIGDILTGCVLKAAITNLQPGEAFLIRQSTKRCENGIKREAL
jgi:hypothetical protein